MSKVLNKLQPILNELYMYSGDQDECCMKHFENGLCILYTGGNPCDQSLYADYQDSGTTEEEWLKWEEDNSYVPESTFRQELWGKVYSTYENLSDKDKDLFWDKVFPYGHITSSSWLHYYE